MRVKSNRRRSLCQWMLLAAVMLCLAGCSMSQSYIEKGRGMAAAGDWDKTVQFLQEALEKFPDDPVLQDMLARAKYEASILHLNKGEVYLNKRRFNEAIAEFQISIALNPTNKQAGDRLQLAQSRQASAQLTMQGHNLLKAQRVSQARDAFEKAAALDSDNHEARQALRALLAKPEQPPKYPLKLTARAPISLKFKKSPILNVFEVLTKLSGINFIFDKDMPESRVTLFMTDVTFDRFIEVLLSTNSLAGKVVNDNTMIIYPNTPAKAKEYNDLEVRTFFLSHLDAKQAVGLLAKIVKSKDIIANEKANSVVIRSTRSVIEAASKIIEANDRTPAEVMLNVEIMDVSRIKEEQLGLDLNPDQMTIGIGEAQDSVQSTSPDEPFFSFGASLKALGNIGTNEILLSIPTATFNFLREDSDTLILAKPQLRVRSGEKAYLLIGERVPLKVNRRIDTTGAVTNDFQYTDIGVKLGAEPIININSEISITLSFEISRLGPNLGTVDDPQFAILTRTTESVLTLLDGQPIIISGLIQNDERNTVRKIPGLGEIPTLGRFFNNYGTDKEQRDILVVITPIITRMQEIPSQDVTQFWSGTEGAFSMREPYQSRLNGKGTQEKAKRTSVNPLPGLPAEGMAALAQVTDGAPNTGSLVESPPAEDTQLVWPAAYPYSIHVNSFAQQQDAMERLEELKRLQYECFMIPAEVPGKGFYYRILVGKYKDLRSAQELCEQYKARGEFAPDIHVVDRKWANVE